MALRVRGLQAGVPRRVAAGHCCLLQQLQHKRLAGDAGPTQPPKSLTREGRREGREGHKPGGIAHGCGRESGGGGVEAESEEAAASLGAVWWLYGVEATDGASLNERGARAPRRCQCAKEVAVVHGREEPIVYTRATREAEQQANTNAELQGRYLTSMSNH